jgi:hypothetical protein
VTAIRSMTRKADEARIRQEMAAAIAAYTGPVTKCPPGKANRWDGQGEATHKAALHPSQGNHSSLESRNTTGGPSRSVAILSPQAPRMDER